MFILIFGIAFFTFVLYQRTTPGRFLYFFIPVWIAATLIFQLRIWGLLTTISIGPEGITYKSLVQTIIFPWSSIERIGLYSKVKGGVDFMQHGSMPKKEYPTRVKYAWFSQLPKYVPGVFANPGKNYCDFEYREKAWKLMKLYLDAHSEEGQEPGYIEYQPPIKLSNNLR